MWSPNVRMVYLTELYSHTGLYNEWRVDRSLLTVLFGRESNVLLGLLEKYRKEELMTPCMYMQHSCELEKGGTDLVMKAMMIFECRRSKYGFLAT